MTLIARYIRKMASESRGHAAGPERYDLAEGVLWDDRAGLVRFVDIREGRVLSARLEGDSLIDTREVRLGETVGAVGLAEDGGLLVAAARRLAVIAPDGDVQFGPELVGPASRFNDGGVDPQGRFVVGTAPLGDPTGEEVLLRVSADGGVETLRSGVKLSNGLGWSPDGATIYQIDTYAPSISSHSYGSGAFDADEPWVPVVTDFPGSPDGMRVDSEGMLWVAMYGGGCVVRYSAGDHSTGGRELSRIVVDAQQPTCPGFVGPGLDRLAITSGIEHLPPEKTRPGDGALYLADPGVTGLPANRWAGSTTNPGWSAAS
jgi:sugar lactone lactonase YvrE